MEIQSHLEDIKDVTFKHHCKLSQLSDTKSSATIREASGQKALASAFLEKIKQKCQEL